MIQPDVEKNILIYTIDLVNKSLIGTVCFTVQVKCIIFLTMWYWMIIIRTKYRYGVFYDDGFILYKKNFQARSLLFLMGSIGEGDFSNLILEVKFIKKHN